MLTSVVTELLQFLMSLGYIGIMIGLMVEIIPSELVLAYAGYLIAKGEITFVGALIAGVIGGTLAQLFLYWIGYYGGRPFVMKYGKYLFIRQKHIEMAESWFNRYGTGIVFLARFVPIVRHVISIPAGLAKMRVIPFTFYTILAMIPWSFCFIYIGRSLGTSWYRIKAYVTPYMPYVIVVVVVFIFLYVYILIQRKKSKFV
ncbi:DedA family protein [Priestia taiwanensis]|uniref:Membrane protein n=1 Tax=Priestia taiwanensis TaxID=1347902 RepID=A0A917AK37_9BACI|nr:DedA family protein [Priestia taiwanensis]MBM7361883.1 membrane protein DedA with SNARE-associated domain [Priestia taiwanensis]GGE57680.1 membrane protein [Priestia taiwanensis]